MLQLECLNSAPGGFGVSRGVRNAVSYPPPPGGHPRSRSASKPCGFVERFPNLVYMGVSAYKCPEIMILGFWWNFCKSTTIKFEQYHHNHGSVKSPGAKCAKYGISLGFGVPVYEDGRARNSIFLDVEDFVFLEIL